MNAAHIHLIINHIPVLGSIAALGLLILSAFKKNEAISKLTLQFMVLIGILTIPAYFTGEAAEEIVEQLPGVSKAFISNHEKYALWALLSTQLLAVVSLYKLFLIKKNSQKIMHQWWLISTVALINVVLMIVTANHGGEIRHTEIRKDEHRND